MFLKSAARIGAPAGIWFVKDGDRIVGQSGAIPVMLKVGDGQRPTAWFVDTMIRDGYRQAGFGARLLLESQQHEPFALSLGQTPEMRQIQFRLGWHQVMPLQTAQLLVRPERVLQGKLPSSVAWAAGLGLRASSAMRQMVTGRKQVEVHEADRFGLEHDRLWQRMSASIRCGVVRDASYLNWKYVDQPRQCFRRLEVRLEGEVRAVVIWMLREPDQDYSYRRGFIVDVVVPPADEMIGVAALLAAVDAAADAGADSVSCLHAGAWLTELLKKAGFYLRAPERFLLVQPGDLSEDERLRVLGADNWFLTQGDSDLDRP